MLFLGLSTPGFLFRTTIPTFPKLVSHTLIHDPEIKNTASVARFSRALPFLRRPAMSKTVWEHISRTHANEAPKSVHSITFSGSTNGWAEAANLAPRHDSKRFSYALFSCTLLKAGAACGGIIVGDVPMHAVACLPGRPFEMFAGVGLLVRQPLSECREMQAPNSSLRLGTTIWRICAP